MKSCLRLFGSAELIRENWIIVSSFRCPLHCFTLLQATTRLSCTKETVLVEIKTCRLFGTEATNIGLSGYLRKDFPNGNSGE